MPENAPIQTTPATPEPTPTTQVPEVDKNIITGGIPDTYGDYLSQRNAIPKPKFRLPLPKKIELMRDSEKFVYHAANRIAQLFDKVSQPDMLQLATTIANVHSNKIMELTSVQPEAVDSTTLDEPKRTELKAQAKGEAGTEIKDWGELVGKSATEGTIIKVDPYFKQYDAEFFHRLKSLNPTWSGEYLQMQRTKDGKIIPKAYNMAAVFQKDPKAFGQVLPEAEVYGSESIQPKDLKQWKENAISDATPDIIKMTPAEYQEYESRATQGFGLPDKVKTVLEGNDDIARILMTNENLFKNFKEELDKAPEITSQSQQAQVFAKSVMKTFGIGKEINPVAYDAIRNMQGMRALESSFNTLQANLAAKMKVGGQAALRESGAGDKLDQYQILQARMLSNPASITDADKQNYAALTLELNDAISKAGVQSLAQDWYEYQSNNKEFSSLIKAFPGLMEAATTKQGAEGIDLYMKQKKGEYYLNNIGKYFPEVGHLEEVQAELDKRGRDKLSALKSFTKGTTEFGTGLTKDIVRFFGDDKAVFKLMKGVTEVQEDPAYITPNRPTNTGDSLTDMVNDFANFGDKTAHGIGQIMVPLVLSTIGGEALELGAFGSQAHYETYNALRNAGVDKHQAETAALVNGFLTAATMKVAFLPSRIVREQIERMSMQDIINAAGGNGSLKYEIMKLGEKLAPTRSDARNAFLAMVQQGAMNIATGVQQKQLGLKPPEQENAYSNMMQVGAITYLLGTLGRMANRGSASMMAKKYADENPMMFATAMDQAKTEAIATGRYNLGRLKQLETDVWNHWKKTNGLPDGITGSQKLAATHILDNIQYYKQQLGKADENLKPVWENKIREAQSKLNEVVGDAEAATKYNNDIVDPVMEHLRQALPEEKAEPFKGLVVRHAETDANTHGRMGTEDDPLTDKGKEEAKKLGEDLVAQKVTKIVTSPTIRSVQTAEATGIEYETDNNLREWQTGSDGKPMSDFDYKHYVNNPDEKPAGGESFNQFLGRVQQARMNAGELDQNTAIITHGNVMKLWKALEGSKGKWDDNAKTEFLKDSNDFKNNEIFTPTQVKPTGDIATTKKKKADGKKVVKTKVTANKTKVVGKEGSSGDVGTEPGEPYMSKNAIRNERLKKVDAALGNSPESAEEAILQFFLRGGKVGKDQFVRSSGFGGKKGHKEMFGKKWAVDPKGKPIDEFAEELAEQYGGDSMSYEAQIVDMITGNTKDQMRDRVLQLNGVRASKGESGYEEALHGNMNDEESAELTAQMEERLKDYTEGLSDDVYNEIVQLLSKYQDKYGEVDFEKLVADNKGFTPEILELSDEATTQLNKIISDYEKEQAARPEAAGDGSGIPLEADTGEPKETAGRRAKTVEEQNIEAQLQTAMDELSAARTAHDAKKKELDKGLMEDQSDLFGERKSQTGNKMFDERVDVAARDKALQPYKERVTKAEAEVNRLRGKQDEAAKGGTTQRDIFEPATKPEGYDVTESEGYKKEAERLKAKQTDELRDAEKPVVDIGETIPNTYFAEMIDPDKAAAAKAKYKEILKRKKLIENLIDCL